MVEQLDLDVLKVVLKYSGEEPADVILVVQDTEFHVNKKFLGDNSEYFKALFFGPFKEANEDVIALEDTDPMLFKQMMELIHLDQMTDETFLECRGVSQEAEEMLDTSAALFALIDRYDMQMCKQKLVERHVAHCCEENDGRVNCSFCASRLFMCIAHGLHFPRKFTIEAAKDCDCLVPEYIDAHMIMLLEGLGNDF